MKCLLNAFLLGLSLALMAGCMSTEKRFERAVNYEERGEYVNAARYYVGVLQKEPDWEEARQGLIRVGEIAVGNYLDVAEEQESTGQYVQAIATLNAMDALRSQALTVGVQLSVPDNYDSYRERLSQAAVGALIRQGEVAEEQGNWAEALKRYTEVQERYELSVDQEEEMRLARARVHLKWAEQDREKGYYRSAYDRAAAAIGILGEDHPRAGGAFDLQDQALAEGTRQAAFLPIWSTSAVKERAPSGMLEELDDMLQYDFWANPPNFIAQADPVQMRREIRRLRYDDRLVTRTEASYIGEVLEADYVVVNQAVTLDMEETRLRESTKRTRTSGRTSQDTTYIEQNYTTVIKAEIEYQIIDTRTRRELASGSVSEDVSARMTRGVYNGDYRDLDLSLSERRIFDTEAREQAIRDLEDELLDKLAPKLADEVFENVLKQIK